MVDYYLFCVEKHYEAGEWLLMWNFSGTNGYWCEILVAPTPIEPGGFCFPTFRQQTTMPHNLEDVVQTVGRQSMIRQQKCWACYIITL